MDNIHLNHFKFQISGKEENDGGSEKYLAGIIVLIILQIISCVTLAYFIHQNRRLKSQPSSDDQSKGRNYSDKVKDDGNYEKMEEEQSTYTALKRPGKEEDDDYLYSHLNEVHYNYMNQAETGI